MARVSKKVSAAQREAENAQHRIWKTAIYARFLLRTRMWVLIRLRATAFRASVD